MCKYSSQCNEADHFSEAYSGPYTDIYDNAAALATTLIEDCYATIKTRYHMSKNSRLGRKPLNKQTKVYTLIWLQEKSFDSGVNLNCLILLVY